MNDQIFILIILVLTVIATMWLYLLKAKKQIIYRGDERWQMIQLRALTEPCVRLSRTRLLIITFAFRITSHKSLVLLRDKLSACRQIHPMYSFSSDFACSVLCIDIFE